MRYLISFSAVLVATVAMTACRTTGSAASLTKDAVDASSLPQSIHGKSLPLGTEVGAVISVTVSSVGAYDSQSMDAFTDALKSRNAARKAAGKTLLFVAPAIDAHKVFFASVANSKIASQDQTAVAQATSDLGLDADTVEAQVVLFFNDSAQALKGVFAKPNTDLSVGIVDASGTLTGSYALPDEQDAALAALDAALAVQDAAAAPAAPAAPATPAPAAPAPAAPAAPAGN